MPAYFVSRRNRVRVWRRFRRRAKYWTYPENCAAARNPRREFLSLTALELCWRKATSEVLISDFAAPAAHSRGKLQQSKCKSRPNKWASSNSPDNSAKRKPYLIVSADCQPEMIWSPVADDFGVNSYRLGMGPNHDHHSLTDSPQALIMIVLQTAGFSNCSFLNCFWRQLDGGFIQRRAGSGEGIWNYL